MHIHEPKLIGFNMDHKWKFACMHDLEVKTHVHEQQAKPTKVYMTYLGLYHYIGFITYLQVMKLNWGFMTSLKVMRWN